MRTVGHLIRTVGKLVCLFICMHTKLDSECSIIDIWLISSIQLNYWLIHLGNWTWHTTPKWESIADRPKTNAWLNWQTENIYRVSAYWPIYINLLTISYSSLLIKVENEWSSPGIVCCGAQCLDLSDPIGEIFVIFEDDDEFISTRVNVIELKNSLQK